jgi:hypothetical protein
VNAKGCKGHISDDSGLTLPWTVAKDGDYVINVTQPNVKYPIWPRLTLTTSTGKQVGQAKGLGKGENANLPEHLAAGTYNINVRDDVDGYAAPFKQGGGLSFWIDIQSAPAGSIAAPSASAVASAAPLPVVAPKPGPKPVGPAPKPSAKPK